MSTGTGTAPANPAAGAPTGCGAGAGERARRGGALMGCGTASDVGKSQLVTGLCRALARRGLRVAPFKGQNMALNSVVTPDGREIARAQGVQARAAGIEPEAAMNPVLLKPTGERRSQVVVMGRPWGELDAVTFQRSKAGLQPLVLDALAGLRRRFDVVLCEGAGSPAEINLFDHDLVNLGLAARAGVPAVVVGDIDRGGVFAHLFGTVALLPEDRRALVRGFVVNKLRGDPALLGGATDALQRRCGVPTLGAVPHLGDLWIDAEDSVALERAPWGGPALALPQAPAGTPGGRSGDVLDVAVVRLPRLANFTDVDPLAAEPAVSVRLVGHLSALGDPDLVVLPGSKATVGDLEWLRASGLADAVLERRRTGRTTVVGVCAGYQMLGRVVEDPDCVEAAVAQAEGLGLLGVRTRFAAEKRTVRRRGTCRGTGDPVEGYEVHHGRPVGDEGAEPWFDLDAAEPDGPLDGPEPEGVVDGTAGVYGTSLHGLFEADAFRRSTLSSIAARRRKRWVPSEVSFAALREAQIDRLADACEAHLDLDVLVSMATGAR